MVAVYGTPVRPHGRYQRPLRWPIRAAMTSPCTSQQELALVGFPMRANVRCFPGIRAARFPPMTSLAHRACAVSCAGQHARIVPETRSVRSANRTRGMQHVMPCTGAHVGPRVFQIQPTLAAILTVRATVFSETRDVPAPKSLHEDALMRAVREMPNGPRTRRLAGPARLPN